jgi:hypothetical protein
MKDQQLFVTTPTSAWIIYKVGFRHYIRNDSQVPVGYFRTLSVSRLYSLHCCRSMFLWCNVHQWKATRSFSELSNDGKRSSLYPERIKRWTCSEKKRPHFWLKYFNLGTERVGLSDNSFGLYSEGAGFESGQEKWLSWLIYFVAFLTPFRKFLW